MVINNAGGTPTAQPPPTRAPGRVHGWYRGDVHVHSTASNGGELTPVQLIAAARGYGLDFIAATDHNSAGTRGFWAALAGSDLIVIPGQEVTTRDGHWLALGVAPDQVVDWHYGVDDGAIDGHLDQVRRAGGLCVAAHPHAPYPTGRLGYPLRIFDAVEVWNGAWRSDVPWQADNEAALADWADSLTTDVHTGRWLPAVGNSDTHLHGQIGIPHTVVRADDPGTAAILAGIRAGRTWLAGSTAVNLRLTVSTGTRTAGIGERLGTRGGPAVVDVGVRGVPDGVLSLHTDRGEVYRAELPADDTGTLRWRTDAAGSAFVRVEVRHPAMDDGRAGQMAALTNPVVLA